MNGTNLVLFVSGKASSGKDTLFNKLRYEIFDEISEEYIDPKEVYSFFKSGEHPKITAFELKDQVVHKFPFADEVKRELVRLQPEVDFVRLLKDSEYKEKYRKELVDIGDGYRENDPLIWIKKQQEELVRFLNTNDKKIVVVTDVRYLNEFVYFETMAKSNSPNIFVSIRIEASLPVRLSRMSKSGMLNYLNRARYNRSECELDNHKGFDLIIQNEQDLSCSMISDIRNILNIWRKL